ncbi:MAG: TolC family protein [Motiliproteus sp.]
MHSYFPVLIISLILSAIAPWAAAEKAVPYNLSLAFKQAWSLSQKQQVSDQRVAAIRTAKQSNTGWFSDTPELSGRYDSDRLTEDEGKIEYELEVEFPLWLAGQKKALAGQLNAEEMAEEAVVQAEKLALAESLRELYWEVMLKRNMLKLAEARIKVTRKITSDVKRHIDSGIFAPSDHLLAKAEALSAKAELLAANQELFQAQQLFTFRTGQALTSPWIVEELHPEQSLVKHPLLLQARAKVVAARSELKLKQVEDREHSRLSIGWSNERENRDEEYQDSFQIGFSMPLGQERRYSAEISKLTTEQLEKEVQLEQLKRDLQASIVIANNALESAQLQEQSAELKKEAREHRVKLNQATFDAGELGLQALLNSLSEADEANQNWQQRRIEVARAISTLNQAMGYLPKDLRHKENKQ